ncbi:MAG: hypothetical protein A4E57_03081 [Syntrophorhabdaceae bacterium PtaU1.Bin034]|jgi:hypothetical protein|nr:MAG: hypothetical protein A4E57_03081 [Syntrophorhabdaceae bacterium PtaU1.Bin034]
MASQWILETEVSLDSQTMEEMLIEIFGCASLDLKIIKLGAGRDKEKAKGFVHIRSEKPELSETYETAEDTLIEIFGCVSLDSRAKNLAAA